MKLQLNLENISISAKKFISKIKNLIHDWPPLKKLSNAKQNYKISHGLSKGFLSPLRTKISNIKNVLSSKIEQDFKTYKKTYLN